MGASWSVVLAELTLPLLVSFLFLFRETRVELARHCSMRDEGGDDEQAASKYARTRLRRVSCPAQQHLGRVLLRHCASELAPSVVVVVVVVDSR